MTWIGVGQYYEREEEEPHDAHVRAWHALDDQEPGSNGNVCISGEGCDRFAGSSFRCSRCKGVVCWCVGGTWHSDGPIDAATICAACWCLP